MLQEIRSYFPPREAESHKGCYGHVLSVCGSYGMAGAAVLAARAALRCGVGLLTAAMPESVYPIITAAVPEAVCAPYAEGGARAAAQLLPRLQKATAVLIGCGLSQSREAAELTAALLNEADCPVVLDADGINAAAKHIDITGARRAPLIVTPHPLEMARLLHRSVEEVQRDRTATATEAARRFQAVVVLKGHGTVVASPEGEVYVNRTGNPGMAVGGSGDVLAGMIAALAAQGLPPFAAARCGVLLHGLAGDRAAARLSQHAMLPSDMIDELGALFLNLEQAE
ncbi:MAG: NAD(P)H-hydrate dehydratase [Clostridia bacterium]|nr:NAD(P)H-hydrate dehydratase [Clostridia bacterium]